MTKINRVRGQGLTVSPGVDSDSVAEVIRDTKKNINEMVGLPQQVPNMTTYATFNEAMDSMMGDDDEDEEIMSDSDALNNLASKKFAEEIKIDFIKSIDYRIMCRFLGLDSVTEVKSYPYRGLAMMVNLLEQVVPDFMKEQGYAFAGELNFDRDGNSIPVEKKVWKVNDKEVVFAISGFLFYEKVNGERKDNIVYLTFYDQEHDIYLLSCYSPDDIKCEQVVNDLEKYAKANNCLRGAKLRDIDIHYSTFSIVQNDPKYTWNNYYYPDGIRELFDNEVFGFLKNTEKYNKYGINKRGLILYGAPGTGKTSIGHIICNEVQGNTVIWITPEMITRFMNSLKEFYQLADFVSPCIVILEDLDLFGVDRDMGGDIHRLGTLMNILDGVNSIANSVTIATTNRLDAIEKALRNRPGRFDRIIEIPALSADLRKKMFAERLAIWKVSDEVLDYIVSRTDDDWTGAQVQEFVNTINLNFITAKDEGNNEITIELIDKIYETMLNFGVGEKVKEFSGFGKKTKDKPSKKDDDDKPMGFGRKRNNG